MRFLNPIFQMLGDSARAWSDDRVTRLAAALAFYAILSLAPLLVLAVAVAGLVFGEDAARGRIAVELSRVVGTAAGEGIEALLAQARAPQEGALGSLMGIVVLFFGASGVFLELQDALNTIWRVPASSGSGLWGFLRGRFFSFSMVMAVAFLLLVSLVLSALLSAVGKYFEEVLPGGALFWEGANFIFPLLVIVVSFALIFKVVPDAPIAWRDVWPGAWVTALLFSLGKLLLGMYLGRASVASPYGAAGSVVVLVIWVYYAAQIFFFGAELTHVYAEYRRGSGVAARPTRA